MSLLFAVVLLICLSTFPNARANQFTQITNLVAPPHSPQQVASAQGVIVTFTILYNNLTSSESIASAVITTQSNTPITGAAASNPDPCLMTGQNASCIVQPHSSAGSESMTFVIILPSSQRYDLQAVVGFVDSSRHLIGTTVSSVNFNINVDNNILLTVSLPNSVPSSVDGAKQTPGTVTIPLQPGVHEVSVPQTAQFANGTRLVFDHWMDDSTQLSRTQDIEDDLTYAAYYNTQYELNVTDSSGTVTGGWFNEGTAAQISAPSKIPIPGILGLLGGTLTFQGWYRNGTLITTSTNYSHVMDSPYTVNVQWTADYTIPEVILIAAFIIGAGTTIGFTVHRRTKSGGMTINRV